jgi:acyl-CoA thioester hydrolase
VSQDGARRDGFSTLQRVRFGDLDAMQHMNNVEFLRFFETARIDFITQLAPDHEPGSPGRFGFIFAECHIAYRAPAHYNDEIRTWIWPAELRRSSLRLGFEMRVEGDDRLVAEGWGTLVGYDYASGRSRPIPDSFRERIEPLLAEGRAEGVG